VKQYLLRRLALMVPGMFLVTVVSFLLLRLSPSDPAAVYAGLDADAAYIARLRVELGLTQPLPVQYFAWLGHTLRGDLGVSFSKGTPVVQLIADALPRTLELGLVALALHAALGIAIGILSALKRDSPLDLAATTIALALISLPSFVLAFGLVLLLSITYRIFPPGGYVSFADDPLGNLRMLVLPALAIGSGTLASIMRYTRSSLLEVLSDDYVRTARAKGLREQAVVLRHALRNALIPVATILGLQIGAMVEGAFIVETIFGWPGIGRLTVDSINARDYSVVQGTVMVAALAFMLSTLATDFVYARLDPRISYAAGDRS
jgi:peptide/nickel transport system permease protein